MNCWRIFLSDVYNNIVSELSVLIINEKSNDKIYKELSLDWLAMSFYSFRSIAYKSTKNILSLCAL